MLRFGLFAAISKANALVLSCRIENFKGPMGMSTFSLSLSSLKRVVAVKKSKDYARRKQKENIRFLSLSLFSNRQSFNVGDFFLTVSEDFSAKA